jgi:DtxR family Mn-dependent transcriptional regulator
MKLSDRAEEILEALWIAVEEKGQGYAERDKIRIAEDDPAYEELTALAYIEVKEGRVYLRPEGKEEGKKTIRRHRLAERLMMDVLNIRGETGEERACQFEHLLNEEVDVKV